MGTPQKVRVHDLTAPMAPVRTRGARRATSSASICAGAWMTRPPSPRLRANAKRWAGRAAPASCGAA